MNCLHWCVESALSVIDDCARWRLLNEPTTLKSALTDPALFLATTLYVPVASTLVFFKVSREKDLVLSTFTVTCWMGLISTSLCNHEIVGVEAPLMLTVSTSDSPSLICVFLRDLSYVITGASTLYTHIIRLLDSRTQTVKMVR